MLQDAGVQDVQAPLECQAAPMAAIERNEQPLPQGQVPEEDRPSIHSSSSNETSNGTSAVNQSVYVQNQINDLNMKHSHPSDQQSSAMTVQVKAAQPPIAVQNRPHCRMPVICETEYAAASAAVVSMKPSVIENTVIQFEFNIDMNNNYVAPKNQIKAVGDQSAGQARSQTRSALRSQRHAKNKKKNMNGNVIGADDFIEPEPLDLEQRQDKSKKKRKLSEFEMPFQIPGDQDREVRKTRLMKKRKLDEEIENCETSKQDPCDEHGASFLKYEFVKKKRRNGEDKNVLLAKRCSMRHRSIGLGEDFGRKLLDALQPNQSYEEMDFEYCPSTVEELFANDQEAHRVQELALQKKVKLQISDISEILGYLDPEEKNLVLVRISVTSEKFRGAKLNQVAAYVGKDGSYKAFVKKQDGGKWHGKFIILEAESGEAHRWLRRNA